MTESCLAGLADVIHDELLPVKPYTDVYADDWFGAGVSFVNANALMNGVGGGLFAPNAAATREQSMTILARMDDEREDAAPYTLSEGVAWAMANGVSDGKDRNAALTREQFVTMLYRYAAEEGAEPDTNGDLSGFADADSVSGWAADAMAWAAQAGIVSGIEDDGGDSLLAPRGDVTRAQLATMLERFAGVAR